MTDFIYEDAFEPDVNIKVIGVGGGGGNALNCMVIASTQPCGTAISLRCPF